MTVYLNYIADARALTHDSVVQLKGWVQSIRAHKQIRFVDLVDETGLIQLVIENLDTAINKESCIEVEGKLLKTPSGEEIHVKELKVISDFSISISPLPRARFDVFAGDGVDNLLSNRHLYLRNPQLQAVLKFRHKFFRAIHDIFAQQGFVEIHAPILTELTLYDERTAFKTQYLDDEIYLTQCAGFYLEACINSFNKVYNIGPSFRAEQTHGRRHLAEYWHVKTELAHVGLPALISFVENLLSSLCKNLIQVAANEIELLNSILPTMDFHPPYPQITYRQAIERLKLAGIEVEFGNTIPPQAEDILSLQFAQPFWILNSPATLEPFPYVINENDPMTTNVADLHAPSGFGELLGVAEKIHQLDELTKRAKEKGLSPSQMERFKWYFDLRSAACVPHGGMGMGVERMIRWLLNLPHVRDTIPFPRLTGRKPRP